LVFIDESALQSNGRSSTWARTVRSCVKDGGGPPGIGFQEQVSNQSELLR
jgi:hypothetical protein